ncbi:zinc finger protein 614-like isoform X2 [Teleopsis dalmanni]|uniref:zinc finger protein 614-like isoform X2 n=1 Tax=Teleopsis dalmanni TaxID=139649 RepID=UPI0018CE9657|nr:zinc finger protein 614-like isoform X2 [Teleopsis dalmanni]
MSSSLTNFDINHVDENGITMPVDTNTVSWLKTEVSDKGLRLKRTDLKKSALVKKSIFSSGKKKRVKHSIFETLGNSTKKKILQSDVNDVEEKIVPISEMSSAKTIFNINHVDENGITMSVDTNIVSWLKTEVSDKELRLKRADLKKSALFKKSIFSSGMYERVENSNKKETVRNDINYIDDVTVGVLTEPKVTNCCPGEYNSSDCDEYDVSENDVQCNIPLPTGFNLSTDVTITKSFKNPSSTTEPFSESHLNAITGHLSESNSKKVEETKTLYSIRLKNNECDKSSPSYFKNKLSSLCQFCDLAFTDQLEQMKHEMCHDKVIPFICHVCGHGFVTRKFLIEHITNVHTLFRPFICVLCNKGYTRRTDLRYHSLTHANVMPFACPICNKNFSSKGNMTKHLRLHNTKHSYICAKCPKSFPTLAKFVAHVKTHITCPVKLSQMDSSLLNEDKLVMDEPIQILPPHIKDKMNLSLDGEHSNREQDEHSFSSLGGNENDISEENLVDQLSQLYTCNVCGDKFQSECAFHKHLDLHLCSFSLCDECGKIYNRIEGDHISNQNDEKNSRNNSNNSTSQTNDTSIETILNFAVANPDLSIREMCLHFNLVPTSGTL